MLNPYQRNGFFSICSPNSPCSDFMNAKSKCVQRFKWKFMEDRVITVNLYQCTAHMHTLIAATNEITRTIRIRVITMRFRSTLSRLRFGSASTWASWKSPEAISFPLKIELFRLEFNCQQAQIPLAPFLFNKFSIKVINWIICDLK